MSSFEEVEDSRIWDYVVVGLGGHGSATLAALATACKGSGKSILGIEQFHPVHARGSSHGQSRIYRQAYFEHPSYVPLLKRSLELWKELDVTYLANGRLIGESRKPLLELCGGIMIGRPDSTVVAGTLTSIAQHNLPHEILTPSEVQHRFPGFSLAEDEIGVFERNAGILRPERCIAAHLEVAQQLGAETWFGDSMIAVTHAIGSNNDEELVSIRTSSGRNVLARKVSLSLGAWATQFPDLLSAQKLGLSADLHVLSKRLFWYPLAADAPRRPADTAAERESGAIPAAEGWPVFIWDLGDKGNFYGFPARTALDRSEEAELRGEERDAATASSVQWEVKVAFHWRPRHSAPTVTDPNTVRSDEALLRSESLELARVVQERLSLRSSDCDLLHAHAATCMYTMTEDENFLIDFHPSFPARNLVVASPCSGHGYKFCSGVGEAIAELLMAGSATQDLSLFRIR